MRSRRQPGRGLALLAVVGVLVVFVALPALAIQILRQFNRGPEAQLVSIERNFYGTDDYYDVDYVELQISHECIYGLDRLGTEYLLVFENDEYVEQRDGEFTVGPVVHWTPEEREWDPASLPKSQLGRARSDDLVAIDLRFERGQISRWVTQPFQNCIRENFALVSPD